MCPHGCREQLELFQAQRKVNWKVNKEKQWNAPDWNSFYSYGNKWKERGRAVEIAWLTIDWRRR